MTTGGDIHHPNVTYTATDHATNSSKEPGGGVQASAPAAIGTDKRVRNASPRAEKHDRKRQRTRDSKATEEQGKEKKLLKQSPWITSHTSRPQSVGRVVDKPRDPANLPSCNRSPGLRLKHVTRQTFPPAYAPPRCVKGPQHHTQDAGHSTTFTATFTTVSCSRTSDSL